MPLKQHKHQTVITLLILHLFQQMSFNISFQAFNQSYCHSTCTSINTSPSINYSASIIQSNQYLINHSTSINHSPSINHIPSANYSTSTNSRVGSKKVLCAILAYLTFIIFFDTAPKDLSAVWLFPFDSSVNIENFTRTQRGYLLKAII